jgi:lactoylglutathione lyase
MRIEHIALYTKDLERMRHFYMTYFNAASNNQYRNEKTGLRTYFLTFDDGSRLEIVTRPEVIGKEHAPDYTPGYTHLAFSVGSHENVDRLTTALEKDGYVVAGKPRTTGDCYYESIILDPDGNYIELTE